MYDYDWGKLVICLNIDDIISTSIPKEKRSVLLGYSLKNLLYQKIKSLNLQSESLYFKEIKATYTIFDIFKEAD